MEHLKNMTRFLSGILLALTLLPILQVYGAVMMNHEQLVAFDETAELIKYCYVRPTVTTPNLSSARPAYVFIRFILQRMIEIDDVAESFSVFGGLVQVWKVPCVQQLYESNVWPLQVFYLDHVDPSKIWSPTLAHLNTLSNVALKDMETRLEISMTTGNFISMNVGSFVSRCDLEFSKFPYDE